MPAQAAAIPAQYEPCEHPDPLDIDKCGQHSTAVATVVLDHPAGRVRIDEPLCEYHAEVRTVDLALGRGGPVIVWYVRPIATARGEADNVSPIASPAVAVGA